MGASVQMREYDADATLTNESHAAPSRRAVQSRYCLREVDHQVFRRKTVRPQVGMSSGHLRAPIHTRPDCRANNHTHQRAVSTTPL